jgi:hypothetical protein
VKPAPAATAAGHHEGQGAHEAGTTQNLKFKIKIFMPSMSSMVNLSQ